MFKTFEKIKGLAKNQGISLNTLEERVGLGKNYIYSLKNKKSPSAEHIAKIADYFDVSTDYLLGRTDNPAIAGDSQVEGQLIDLRKAAAKALLFDGKPLNKDDIDFITSVLSAHFKSKGEGK